MLNDNQKLSKKFGLFLSNSWFNFGTPFLFSLQINQGWQSMASGDNSGNIFIYKFPQPNDINANVLLVQVCSSFNVIELGVL